MNYRSLFITVCLASNYTTQQASEQPSKASTPRTEAYQVTILPHPTPTPLGREDWGTAPRPQIGTIHWPRVRTFRHTTTQAATTPNWREQMPSRQELRTNRNTGNSPVNAPLNTAIVLQASPTHHARRQGTSPLNTSMATAGTPSIRTGTSPLSNNNNSMTSPSIRIGVSPIALPTPIDYLDAARRSATTPNNNNRR